ncbi:hypothetical protein E2493_15060 [Sphingomonas parva]|uniref:Uncharacterized protein n=1 Tax=Sphingomonas parva TaxID=2555898 RepID=A0A4Y8ZRI6_9SPHN|nr:hypothetical protein [Sphingomonas parva]TFI57399.1 hypothetical protein E2493_15060 [Sphingomonas parva]
MAQRRAIDAIGRIEEALARIEAAADSARAAQPRPEPDGDAAEAHQRLRRAHDALRSRVEGAIAQIDRLIGSESAG